MKTTGNTQPQDITSKAVQRSTYYLSLAITFLVTSIIGIVGGYFVSLHFQNQARQAVLSDMHLVSKDEQR